MDRSAIVSFMTVVSCLGQTYTANLTGVISDPTGGAVPGVAVKLENVATSEKRETVTGGEGRFTFSQLLPGAYELQAEATGFKAVVQRNIVLTAGQSAAAVQVDTQTANQSVMLSRDMVRNLPTNLRNPFTLVYLTAPRDSLE